MLVVEQVTCDIDYSRVQILQMQAPNGCTTHWRSLTPDHLYMVHPLIAAWNFVDIHFGDEPAVAAAAGIVQLHDVALVDRSLDFEQALFRLDVCLNLDPSSMTSFIVNDHDHLGAHGGFPARQESGHVHLRSGLVFGHMPFVQGAMKKIVDRRWPPSPRVIPPGWAGPSCWRPTRS